MSAIFELRSLDGAEALLSLPAATMETLLLFVSDQEDKDRSEYRGRVALFDSPNFPEDVPWSGKLPPLAPGGAPPAGSSRPETAAGLELLVGLLEKHGAAWSADPDWKRVRFRPEELAGVLRSSLEAVRRCPEGARFEAWVTF